jgi:hypothetical protein
MFHAYIKTVLCTLEAHAEVPATDITVACYGAALQMHVPHAAALLGPNLTWEIWRADEHAALFEAHLSKQIEKRTGSVEDFFAGIAARPDRRFVCLVDLDLHLPAHVLRARNRRGIRPTVESENRFYEDMTAQYAGMCRRAGALPQVLVVSIPFRAPWLTEDFEANKQHARWLQADGTMLYPKLGTFRQYSTRPRSTEVRGLCWCGGRAAADETVDWRKIDADMQASNARRVFRDYDVLRDFIGEYTRHTAARADLFANETAASKAWRESFVENSLAYAGESEAHAGPGQKRGAEAEAVFEKGVAGEAGEGEEHESGPNKRVRFAADIAQKR